MKTSVLRNLFTALLFAALPVTASAQGVWTGASSNLWSNAGNWNGTAPTSFATIGLTFGDASAQNLTNNNDLGGLNLSSLSFSNTANSYLLQGNAFILSGDINKANATSHAIDNNIAVIVGQNGNGQPTISLGTGGTMTFNGVISGGAGGLNFTSSGGNLALNGVNTYTGRTAFTGSSQNTVSVSNLADGGIASSLGASSSDAANLQFNNTLLIYNGVSPGITNRLFTLGAGGATLRTDIGSGVLNFTNTGPIAIPSDANIARTLTLRGSNTGVSTFSPQIVDGSGQRVVNVLIGGGTTWALTNSNTYTGGTTVDTVMLLVNNTSGSGTGTGAVTVTSGSTLGGNGTINGPVTINSNGRITAGTGTGAGNTDLTINNTLSLGANSRYNVNLFGVGTTDISLVAGVSGGTTIASTAAIHLNLSALSQAQADQLRAAVGEGNTRTYTVMTGVAAGSSFTGANQFVIDNLGGFNPNEWVVNSTPIPGTVQLNYSPQPVPEPATILALAATAFGVGRVIRRRNRPAPAAMTSC